MPENIEQIIDIVIEQIKNTAMINNSKSPVLYISMNENSMHVNGDGVLWDYKFSQAEINAVMQKLINMGAIPKQNEPNKVIFTDPSLLLPKPQEVKVDYEIVNSVIEQIKNTAMINNSESPVLYISMNENSMHVNGDGVLWDYKFSQAEIDAVMQELINMGAVPKQDEPNKVTFTDPSLLLNKGRKK